MSKNGLKLDGSSFLNINNAPVSLSHMIVNEVCGFWTVGWTKEANHNKRLTKFLIFHKLITIRCVLLSPFTDFTLILSQSLVGRLKENLEKMTEERNQRIAAENREKEQNKRMQRQIRDMKEEMGELSKKEGEASRKKHELVGFTGCWES